MDVPHAALSPPETLQWLRLLCSRSTSPHFSSSTGFSATPFLQNVKRQHVPMAFSELQESVSNQPLHSCRFIPDRAQFVLPLREQTQSPRSPVRAKASVGRMSGALHSGNSKKHRLRRRSDTIVQDDSCEHSSQDDRSISCDDSSNDSDADYPDCSDMAAGTDNRFNADCPADCLASISVYDSIHGEFWWNDPYYQELEALDFRDGWQSEGVEKVPVSESFVDNQGGNGAIVGIQLGNDMDCRSDLQTALEEVHQTIPKDTCNSFQEVVGAAEDHQEIIHDQVNSDDYGFRKAESAELSTENFEFLGESEINNANDGCFPSDTGLDERNLGQRTDFEADLSALAATSKNLEVDKRSASEDFGMARTTGSEAEESKLSVDSPAMPVVEQVGPMVGQVTEVISDSFSDQVVTVDDQVEKLPQGAEEVIMKMVDQVSEVLPEPVIEQVGQVAEQLTQTAEQLVEQVTTQFVEPISTTTSQIAAFLSSDQEDEESEDEFEAYTSLDIPEFKGRQGLNNFIIMQEEQGLLTVIYNFYIFMLKRSLFEFFLGMFTAPILLSMVFTFLYLPQFSGLAFDETVREFIRNSDPNTEAAPEGLQLSWETVFRVFMFSVSLSTGLQPELAPLSPYTLVVANLNALLAQLIFVFLSGAVFARLSQPSLPVKCSKVAIICPPPANRRLRKEVCHKALLTRYVLVGPQPCELVDVKVDLTYHYNTVTRSGTYFRTSQSLKLVRPEISFLDHGMLVRHIIDETSPLYQRTPGMLEKEDAVFSLSVVGLERSSMQSVFHVQHYCVHDKDVIWDAEFVDMILINKKNQRVVDHSLLSNWRLVVSH